MRLHKDLTCKQKQTKLKEGISSRRVELRAMNISVQNVILNRIRKGNSRVNASTQGLQIESGSMKPGSTRHKHVIIMNMHKSI